MGLDRNPKPYPRILCLHGGGTCSSIFRIQVGRLQRILSNEADFVFLDTPFECPPGPGVLPTFEGAGPFYKWTSGPDHAKPTDENPSDFPVIQDTIQRLTDENGHFVGILAFSQGVRTAATLLSQINPTVGQHGQHQISTERAKQFSFGVLIAGTFPPLHHTKNPNNETNKNSLAHIVVPTVHVLGKYDPIRAESLHFLRQCCEPLNTTVVNFEGSHEVPTDDETLELIAGHIRDFLEQRE